MAEEFVESNQRFAVNLALGLILWVFSVFLFQPLIVSYASNWAGLISVLLVATISYYLVKAMMSSGPIFEYASKWLTSWWIGWRKLDAGDRQTHRRVEKAIKTGVLLLVYLLYRQLLLLINPALAGITFVLVLIYLLKIVLEKK